MSSPDVPDWHDYAVRRHERAADFSVNGTDVRTCRNPPTYPLQVMTAVLDFPRWSRGDDPGLGRVDQVI